MGGAEVDVMGWCLNDRFSFCHPFSYLIGPNVALQKSGFYTARGVLMESFLIHYGLAAVALLAIIDGDVTLILAGVIAHLGLFSLPAGIAAGSAGAFIG